MSSATYHSTQTSVIHYISRAYSYRYDDQYDQLFDVTSCRCSLVAVLLVSYQCKVIHFIFHYQSILGLPTFQVRTFRHCSSLTSVPTGELSAPQTPKLDRGTGERGTHREGRQRMGGKGKGGKRHKGKGKGQYKHYIYAYQYRHNGLHAMMPRQLDSRNIKIGMMRNISELNGDKSYRPVLGTGIFMAQKTPVSVRRIFSAVYISHCLVSPSQN